MIAAEHTAGFIKPKTVLHTQEGARSVCALLEFELEMAAQIKDFLEGDKYI